MRFSPRQGLLAGVAALGAGVVVLDIALARTTEALLGEHLALVASALALFGAGLGGALLASLPELTRRSTLLARMAYLAGLAAAATLASLLVLLHVKVPDALGRPAWTPLAVIFLTAALPFVLAGVALAGAVRHVAGLGGRVVWSALTGAALGGPAGLLAVQVGAPRAALVAAIVFGVAALLFYLGALSWGLPRPRGALVATFLLAGAVLLAGDLGAPWAKLPALRFASLDKVEAQEWTPLGLLLVDKPTSGMNWMHTDGATSVPIYEGKTTVALSPDEMAYVLHHDQGPVAVIGGGGGREVRVAQKYGQKEILAVDLDPVAVHGMMLGRYKKSSGDVYESPGVTVAVGDGRGYVRRAGKAFRNIELALPEPQAPVAAGVLATLPNDLLTVEAFTDFFDHLTPDGTLVVSRWDAEADRLVALASAALARIGVERPSRHLFGCSANHVTAVLAAKTPLEAREVSLLRKFCGRSNKLNEVYSPDNPHGEQRRHLADAPASAPATPLDLRAPTDDRPFFALSIPADQLLTTLTAPKATTQAQGLLGLAGFAGVAALLVFFSLGLPLAAWPRSPVGRVGPLLYFAGIGAALALASSALLPRLGVLLGHPGFVFFTVIPALFASMGAGALFAARARADRADASAGLRAEVFVAVLAATAAGLGPLVDGALGLPFGARAAAALLAVVPAGVLAGSLLALGLKVVSRRSPALLPWCWGTSAVGAFVALAAAAPVVLFAGYSVALLMAGVSALVAAVFVPRGLRGGAGL